MNRTTHAIALGAAAAIGLFAASATTALDGKPRFPFPEGYRTWFHVKSAIVNEGSATPKYAGLHHIYANAPAMKGFETGTFPDGSIVVFDLLSLSVNPNHTETEGDRKLVDVMMKDSQKYKATGGWDFEEFVGNDRTSGALTTEASATCAACHAKSKTARDMVFTQVRQ